MAIRKKFKRPRVAHDDRTNSSESTSTAPASATASLTGLPIEILAEILLNTSSPPTVLAVSRTCSFLYHTLARNPAASFIWRGVRRSFHPAPLPEPDHWHKSEADYAAFVFDGGTCEVCHKMTRSMYVSFAARIRLCGSWYCRRKFLNEFLIDITANFVGKDPHIWIPYVESELCFRPSLHLYWTWPDCPKVFVRKTDWVKYRHDRAVCVTANPTLGRRGALAPDTLSAAEQEEYQETTRVLERCNESMTKFGSIMELSVQLIVWKVWCDQELKKIKKQNRNWTRTLAETEGWNLEDLRISQTYAGLTSYKTSIFQTLEMKDVNLVRSGIEAELLEARERRERRNSEITYGKKLAEIKKTYERMRCGTLRIPHTGEAGSSDTHESLIFPPLSVFCTLPSVRALKGSPDPHAAPSNVAASEINSPLATSLILADIQAWLAPVQKHFMNLLGYSNGWKSASAKMLPPLQRLTARFFCRRCGEGKVGRRCQRELCLDFKGVCSHVCTGVKEKHGSREAPVESEAEPADTDGEQGREEGKRRHKRKRKSGTKTLDWKLDLFEKDEKAIRVIKTVLDLTGRSEEDCTASSLKDEIIRCMSCTGWIVMDFDTAIGHAHRHESMEIQLLSQFGATVPERDSVVETGVPQAAPFAFVRGRTEQLLTPSRRASKLCEKVEYGCKHCLEVVPDNFSVAVYEPRRRGKCKETRMNFNGLRSHLKEKHGIQDVRDEDFICYST